MKNFIKVIFQNELDEEIESINEIVELGSVNKVYEVKGKKEDYIIRINDEENKKIEYLKEKWCIQKAESLGIPSPTVFKNGIHNNSVYMIQKKISGVNGKNCKAIEKELIWKTLGNYASKFQTVKRIEVREIEENEFHENWKAKLIYNLTELNESDSLLKKNVLTSDEHKKAKRVLSTLINKEFRTGLVHGDLCPRNVIWNNEKIHLLDWGTAEINIIPHTEIGIIMMTGEASEREFQSFLSGLGISSKDFKKLENELHILNLLHRLDKYRWAEGNNIKEIKDYEDLIRSTLEKI